ncbi:MAG: CBS domain-containing protein, partial [Elusimicrobia bacterium]|nr:CBS domain-containing protein [Elusimicrobiota bacterium]
MGVDTKSILVNESMPVREMLEVVTRAGSGLAVVVDSSERFIGVVADGDVRRALLKGVTLEDPVSAVVNRSAVVAYEGMPPEELFKMLNMRHRIVPVLDAQRRVKGLLSYSEGHAMLNVRSKTVCVLGMGYVGLPMAVTLADVGFKVVGLEVNPTVLKSIQAGRPHFHEEGLEMALQKTNGKNLILLDRLDQEVCDIYIITVGTPIDKNTQRPNLKSVEAASQTIGARLKRGDVVILRST